MVTIAVLDDYLDAARSHADWTGLPGEPEIRFYHDRGPSREELIRRLSDVDIICTMRERTRIDADMIASLPRLRLIAATGRGQASIDVWAATERGIPIAVTGGSSMATGPTGDPTAEITLGLMIAVMRQIPAQDAALRRGVWQTHVGTGLGGKTLGVLGLGRIGSRVAAACRVFEMTVIAWGPTLTPERAAQNGAEMVSKEELFRRSDVVTIHWVLNDVTRSLVGRAELGLMKPSAYLVNTARGPLVQEDALLEVLREGRIAGAGLDVYDREPLPADHPLLGLSNVVLAPHLGYATAAGYRNFYGQTVRNLRDFLEGRLTNVLDPEALKRMPSR